MDSKNKLDIYKELQKELEERKKRQVVFQKEFISVEVDMTHEWIYSNWIGYQTKDSVEEGCIQVLENLKKFNFNKVLNDNTNVLGIWTPAVPWLSSIWFPQMLEAGLKKFAWVYSPSALSQFSTNETLKETTPNHSVRTFHSIDEAKGWLKGEESSVPGNGNAF